MESREKGEEELRGGIKKDKKEGKKKCKRGGKRRDE